VKLCPACSCPIEGEAWVCSACRWQAEAAEGIPLLGGGAPAEGEGYSTAFYATLAEREAGHFWFIGRNRLLLWAFRRYAAGARSFLEIGCGTGFVLQGLAGLDPGLALTGSELFREGLAFASRRVPGAAFVQLDARRLPYRDEFDAIGLFDVLEHIQEDQLVLDNVARACRPGGTVLVTVPQHPWLWTVVDERACHVRRYRRGDLVAKLRRSGLKPVRACSFVSLLLPVLALNRMLRQQRREAFDLLQEFDLPSWKQRLLLAALDLERALIRAGVDLPMGGSLLVVARKPQR
jgi:SAM-dependent methyltransferase